ncbi:MAG: carbohydrate porin [Acidobacteriaceae bacterium]|nr:carbohydrate porin [Acidobacteriaceae bacterium]
MTDLLFDVEETNGHNVSNSLGLGGFTNADTVGVPNNHPYIARAIFHQIIPLSSDYVQVERDPLHLADRLPARRVELFAGKVNMVDFFDVSGIASDSHLQFLNWAIENNAAYGYPADSRGYTDAFLVEYHDHAWAIRFAQAWQAIAESPDKLDADIGRSVSQHIEFEIPTNRITKQSGLIRSLAFFDNGTLGIYRDAIDAYLAGIEPVPEIDAYRRPGQLHYGFGIGLEQEVSPTVRIFGRFGWAEGHKQSTAFAEVDQTFAGGFDMLGRSWRRPEDRVGAGFVSSALSGDHRRYLALGGLGFALGDGALNYGREQIFETFYNARILNGIYVAADLQAIWNPGYNRDRGPIIVAAMRLFLTGALYSHPQ